MQDISAPPVSRGPSSTTESHSNWERFPADDRDRPIGSARFPRFRDPADAQNADPKPAMWNAASRCIVRRAFLALLALGAFTVTLQAPAGDAASKKVPSSTSSVTVAQATETSLSLSWQRVRSAAGYDLYLDQTRVATTQTTAYTLAGLRCGSTYQLGVDSFNARGVRSSIVNLAGSTRACPVAPVGGDASPPTSPATLSQGATSATSISLLWSASLDNVGVAGYELFLNGNKVGTTTGTSYSFANLSCGTSYTLAVDAYDAAGNRSQPSSVSGTTSACTTPTAPAPSGNCTATLNPSSADTLDTQFNDPSKGNVVCLRGGDYGSPSVYTDLTRSGTSSQRLTLQSVPGETAVIHGYLAVDSSWITLAHIKIDATTTPQGTSSNCPGQSIYGNFTLAGSNIVVEESEITASNQAQSGNGIYVTGSNEEIKFNKIHDVGACRPYDHGIYLHSGSGTQIHDNWLWNLPDGWGVQVYPTAGDDHIYANVIDRAMSGFVVCSTGSNTIINHNIVMNAAAGSLISGCGPQGSSTGNVVNDNDSFNNAAGFGNVANVSMAGNFSADPQFVDPASHNYQVSPTSPLLSWNLWTGS